jgi:hypothetical protein
VLSRAERYDLPACEIGDPPSVIYTHQPNLDMDVLLSCSEMGGEAAWRSLLTTGGVIADTTDLSQFIAAVGSGLPGTYVLRLAGDGQDFSIPLLTVLPYQDTRIILIANGGSLYFSDVVTVASEGSLRIQGTADYLEFSDGVELAPASSVAIVSSTDRSIKVALGTPWFAVSPTYNQGSFTLQVRIRPSLVCVGFS